MSGFREAKLSAGEILPLQGIISSRLTQNVYSCPVRWSINVNYGVFRARSLG